MIYAHHRDVVVKLHELTWVMVAFHAANGMVILQVVPDAVFPHALSPVEMQLVGLQIGSGLLVCTGPL